MARQTQCWGPGPGRQVSDQLVGLTTVGRGRSDRAPCPSAQDERRLPIAIAIWPETSRSAGWPSGAGRDPWWCPAVSWMHERASEPPGSAPGHYSLPADPPRSGRGRRHLGIEPQPPTGGITTTYPYSPHLGSLSMLCCSPTKQPDPTKSSPKPPPPDFSGSSPRGKDMLLQGTPPWHFAAPGLGPPVPAPCHTGELLRGGPRGQETLESLPFGASPGPSLIWFQTLGCSCQRRPMPGPSVRGGVPGLRVG